MTFAETVRVRQEFTTDHPAGRGRTAPRSVSADRLSPPHLARSPFQTALHPVSRVRRVRGRTTGRLRSPLGT